VFHRGSFRGRLIATSVSLIFLLSYEILKWQFPASAACEKLAMAATAFRSWPRLRLLAHR